MLIAVNGSVAVLQERFNKQLGFFCEIWHKSETSNTSIYLKKL